VIPTRLKPCPCLAVDPDPTAADGVWHHRRNGVSGIPFHVRIAGHGACIERFGALVRGFENPNSDDGVVTSA